MTSVSTDRRQGVNSGAAVKVPVRTATTAAIVIDTVGLAVIDGVQTVDGDRVLVKNQADPTENGIYVAGTGPWERDVDCDGYFDLKKGTFVYCTNGATTVGFWYVTSSAPIPDGSIAITWAQASTVLAAISAFVQTLLPAANAAAFMTTLGISAFVQTMLDDADANAVLATLGIAGQGTSSNEFTYQQHGAI